MLIGREKEQRTLLNLLQKDESQFCAIYGRRRVGKTYLIRQTFQNNFLFTHTGVAKGSKSTQLKEFYLSLQRYGLGKQHAKPQDWSDAFHLLLQLIEENRSDAKKVIFLDELSWLDGKQSDFVSALEHFWNGYISARTDVVLITCCSSTTWVINNIINNTGGLYNRVTEQINLLPFTLKECEDYSKAANIEFSKKDIAEAYMIMGGIPYYWSFFRKGESLAQNIDRLFFADNASFKNEFEALYASLFKRPDNYISIVKALGSKKSGMQREEILQATRLSNNTVFKRMLVELEQSGFIKSYNSFGKRKNNLTYQLVDNFTLFYLQFMLENKTHDNHFWSAHIDSALYYTWAGLAFERLCLWHLPQIKNALGIAGVSSECYTWRENSNKESKGYQIDLIIDRKDNIINLCELKFSNSQYSITCEYDAWMRQRKELFRANTKTRKAIHLTMITTYGVKHNTYWNSIQSEIILEDLFSM